VIVATTTLRDNAANVRRFVTGNLGHGVDHLVVYVDGPVDPVVTDLLGSHPHVTMVDAATDTDGDWWGGARPDRLNTRQKIHANLTRTLLGRLGIADWLLHLDGDEVAVLDRDVLDTLGPEVTSVDLETLECVAELAPACDPVLFKRQLGPAELALLHQLGVIDEPDNRRYFRGHLRGRPALRPAAPLWLGIHTAKDLGKEPVEGLQDDALRVLHFESPSGEEFVRKWQALTSSGPGAVHHGARATLADNVRTLLGLGLAREVERDLLLRLFEAARADDVETLRQLGLLVEIDVARGTHTPAELPAGDRGRLESALARLRGVRKQMFSHPDLRDRADRVIAEATS
jgi:hypothetical protein